MDKVSILSEEEEKGEENEEKEEKEVPQVLTSHEDANKAIVEKNKVIFIFFFGQRQKTSRQWLLLPSNIPTNIGEEERRQKTTANQDRRVKIKQE